MAICSCYNKCHQVQMTERLGCKSIHAWGERETSEEVKIKEFAWNICGSGWWILIVEPNQFTEIVTVWQSNTWKKGLSFYISQIEFEICLKLLQITKSYWEKKRQLKLFLIKIVLWSQRSCVFRSTNVIFSCRKSSERIRESLDDPKTRLWMCFLVCSFIHTSWICKKNIFFIINKNLDFGLKIKISFPYLIYKKKNLLY